MSNLFVAIFCTLALAAGLHYLTRSGEVDRLAAFETRGQNRLRRVVRRLGAWAMILLAASLFWGMLELQHGRPTARLIGAWASVLVVLSTMIVCVAIDVGLTIRLRRHLARRET
jgi:hypothetical protein